MPTMERFEMAQTLNLSPRDFREFLKEAGYMSDFEMRVDPHMVCKLAEDNEVINEYEQTRTLQRAGRAA